jgi:hypothetical protein
LFGAKIGALRALKDKMGPEWFAKNWPTISLPIAADVKELMGVELGGEFTPEYDQVLNTLDDKYNEAKTGAGTGFELSPGQTRFDASGKPIASIPAKPEAQNVGSFEDYVVRKFGSDPSPQQIAQARKEYAAADNQGDAGTWAEAVGPDGKPILFNAKTGQAKPYPEGVQPKLSAKERAVTGAERKVLGFYNRAMEAIEDIGPLEENVAKYSYLEQQQLQNAPNVLQKSEQKRYRQAQRAFTEARLRKESGAAVPESEYENDARTYFAQPGDDAKVIEQKRRGRETVLQSMKYEAGRAYDEFFGEPAPKPADTKGPPGAGAVPKATHRWTPNGLVPVGGK